MVQHYSREPRPADRQCCKYGHHQNVGRMNNFITTMQFISHPRQQRFQLFNYLSLSLANNACPPRTHIITRQHTQMMEAYSLLAVLDGVERRVLADAVLVAQLCRKEERGARGDRPE